MPDTTPGELAYVAYVRVRYGLPDADAALTYTRSIPEERAAWEAAAEAVRAGLEPQGPCLLYVVVMQAGYQIQLCGAYPNADEAGIHLAHARTIMPEQHFEVRVCPFALTGQAHRLEDIPHA